MKSAAQTAQVGTDIDVLVSQCRELHEDVELTRVRRWKESGEKRVAIGYLPIYIPGEIVHAAGALPVGIIGGGDRTDIIRGDAYFQSYICRIPRSTVELGLQGKLKILDGILFPAICDVIRNLSGIWQLMFPEHFVKFVDFPQNFSPNVGGWFYKEQLAELFADLCHLTGKDVDLDRLRDSSRLYNQNRSLIQELHATRTRQPDLIPTSEAYLIQRAGHLIPVEEHNQMLRQYLDLALSREEIVRDYARIIIVGSFCEQPPLSLIRSLELAGCYIVEDDLLLGNRMLTSAVRDDGDPLECLVDTYLTATAPSACVYDVENKHASQLVARVREKKADGVVFASPSFCDPALLDRPRCASALDEAGIPYTSFKYSENTAQLGAIREQVGTFAESIRLWGTAPELSKTARRKR